jgi:hypothetical protein
MMMTTTTSTTTLFTISMMIAIVGMMNDVPIVLGADVKQAESNLCYAVRLDKECNASTDETSCWASDKQCFWFDDKCQSPFANIYRAEIETQHNAWTSSGMQMCALGSMSESVCTNIEGGNTCEWDATSSHSVKCMIKKTGVFADMIYDKFSMNYHLDSSKCWVISSETNCNADSSCTWTTAPDGGTTYCGLTKTISDLYDDYCNATTTWYESLIADDGVCKLRGKEMTCEALETATDCGKESGCSWSDEDNECYLNTEFEGKLQTVRLSGLLSGVKKRTKCSKLGFVGEASCTADSECEWLGLGEANNCGATLATWKTASTSDFGGTYLYGDVTCNLHENENACNANVMCTWACEHDDHDDHDDHDHRVRHALRIRHEVHDGDDCWCEVKESIWDPGMCPAEYFPTQSVPAAGIASATGAVTLTGYTAAQFGDDQREAFVRGIAMFLNVPVPLVTITHVHDVSSRKRRNLKSSSIEVDYSVSGSVTEVQNIVDALDGAGAQSNIGAALEVVFEARGLTAPSVTAVTASAILPSPPPSPPPPSSAHAFEKGTLCIIAIVSAFLLF